jgi:metal-responsive CopG/Arc/MetJ family transcriptional regulator
MINKTFSIRIDNKLIKEAERVATERRWSRNQAIAYLIELGLKEEKKTHKEHKEVVNG